MIHHGTAYQNTYQPMKKILFKTLYKIEWKFLIFCRTQSKFILKTQSELIPKYKRQVDTIV